MPEPFDLRAYLERIGLPRAEPASVPALRRVHRAHMGAIPFENLDIQMGLPIALDPASLQAALVGRRRGGYCFQHNGLFRLALSALGYEPRPREARVRGTSGQTQPRTHMALTVALDNHDWLVDVGFGADGIVEPIRMDGSETVQDGWTYRVHHDGPFRVLQRATSEGWDGLYSFVDADAEDIDYVVGNWYTSTHPDSRFVRMLTAQRMVGDQRYSLHNLSYGVAANGGDWQTTSVARGELVPLLRDVFDIDLPVDATFRALDDVDAGASPRSIVTEDP